MTIFVGKKNEKTRVSLCFCLKFFYELRKWPCCQMHLEAPPSSGLTRVGLGYRVGF